MLGLAAAVADGRAELLAVARVQPLIGFVDAGVGQVGQVAAGLGQRGLAGNVAPDDAQLLAVALAAQVARQLVLILGGIGRGVDLRTQLARRVGLAHRAAGQQFEQHRRITLGLGQDEIAGGGDLVELASVLGAQAVQIQLGVTNQGIAHELLVASDQRLEDSRQIERQRQAHGLSLIGVKESGCAGQTGVGPRLDCRTKVGNS